MSWKSSDPKALWTPPADPRFHQQNVTGWCFVMYRDFKRCWRLFEGRNPDCEYFRDIYKSICPNYIIERCDAQVKKGTFPTRLPCPKTCK